jgi:molybdate transport system ATP-binding protein
MICCEITKKLQDATGEMPLSVDFEIDKGERVALYGPSGAGKTSTLRMLAGLMEPDSGFIEVNGTVWYDSKTNVKRNPGKRNIGFVFQDFALFPNMTVGENLRYAKGKRKNALSVTELIEVMELGDLQHRLPGVLSGGQQQRVALARALVGNPDLLLMDEPLSALDTEMRQRLQAYLSAVHKQYGITMIFISHDLGEVFNLADRVLLMQRGIVIQKGTPEEVFNVPKRDGDFTILGVLLRKITESQEICNIAVRVQSQIFTFAVPQALVDGVEIGNQIQLSGYLSEITINQITASTRTFGSQIKP